MTGRPMASASSTAIGWFSYHVLGTTATDERAEQVEQLVLGQPAVERHPPGRLGGGQRLQVGPDRTVAGDVQVGRLGQVGDGPDGDVDALLGREPAGDDRVAARRRLRLDAVEVDEVADDVHPVRVDAARAPSGRPGTGSGR